MRFALGYLTLSLMAGGIAGLLTIRVFPVGEAVGVAWITLALTQVLLAVWDESLSEHRS
jgi:hypothetical protein